MTTIDCDLAIYGATPGGIFAALTAARYGRSVALCSYGRHVGGLLSSGLSIANIRYRHVHAGPFDEFARAVERHYVSQYGPDATIVRECRGGTWWEPHVAEAVFEQLLGAEPRIQVLRDVRLAEVSLNGGRMVGFTVRDQTAGKVTIIRAPVSVDATYEGDLATASGVPYRVGREAREEYWEPHAGVVHFDTSTQAVLPGSTGEGDGRIQAYCYRLSVTQRPEIHVPFPRPEAYDPNDYRDVQEAIAAGRVQRLRDVMLLGPDRVRVNGKADVIANMVGGADAYPEATESEREAIARRHRNYTLGLFWFLQHDESVPAAVREEALAWGLAADEFVDNGHFPHEIYVREARRIRGKATATEHDFLLDPGADRSPVHADAVAVADFTIDSHATQVLSEPPYEEGHLLIRATQPGQVRYGSLFPEGVSGLLVPVAVSSTHVGFSVIRMEPVWMALGAVAATAAHLALAAGTPLDALPVEPVQAELARRSHRLAFFYDVPLEYRSPGLQFFATKGLFDSFYARPDEAVTRLEASRWIDKLLELTGEGTSNRTADTVHESNDSAFADVAPDQPYYASVQRLHALGIVDGWLDSAAFCPSAPLRRVDALRWMTAAAQHLGLPAAREPVAGDWGNNSHGDLYAPVRRAELCDDLFGMFGQISNTEENAR